MKTSLLIGFVHKRNIPELERIGAAEKFDHVVGVPFQTRKNATTQVQQLLQSVEPFSQEPEIATVLAIDLDALVDLGVTAPEITDIAEKVRARMKTNDFIIALNTDDFTTGNTIRQTVH